MDDSRSAVAFCNYAIHLKNMTKSRSYTSLFCCMFVTSAVDSCSEKFIKFLHTQSPSHVYLKGLWKLGVLILIWAVSSSVSIISQ